MDIGDKVKLVKGNPFGKVGKITFMFPFVGPIDLSNNPKGLDTAKPVMHFTVQAEDGTTFSAAEDQLELLE